MWHSLKIVKILSLSTALALSSVMPTILGYTFTIHNITPVAINVSLGQSIGPATKVWNIAPNTSYTGQISYDIVKGKVKVYYAQDIDFKYHFLSSEPIYWVEKIIEPITKFKPRNIYIYPNAISYDTSQPNASSGLSKKYTLCRPCQIDPHAIKKVQEYYRA